MTNYTPISCDFHSILEHYATLKEVSSIQYTDANNNSQNTNGIITDIYTKSGEEFITLDTGLTIRLDQITQVNDVSAASFGDSCKI